MLDENTKEDLFAFINQSFENGHNTIYYTALFKEFSDKFLTQSIFDPDILREYLKYQNTGKYYVFKEYLSKDKSVNQSISDEIIQLLVDRSEPFFQDELSAMLPHIDKNNCNKLKENTRHILMLEEVLLRKLKESDLDFICNTNVNHIPGNISLSFKGISGETLMHRLDLKGIMVSTGSACDSAKNQTSHVIKALGVPEDYAYGTIRISLGKENTEDEIEEIFIAINEIVKSLTV